MKYYEEVMERFNKEEDKYKLVGAEIRYRRTIQSMTLTAVSDDVCSISYLCKLEQNSICPNPLFLTRICEKVNISEYEYDNLINLKQILLDTIKAFFNNNDELMKDCFKKSSTFKNYRSSLIEFIYVIFKGLDKDVTGLIRDLDKLLSQMSDLDLFSYITFRGIYDYMNNKVIDASDNFKLILDVNPSNQYLEALAIEYLFYTAYKVNSSNTYRYYMDAIEQVKSLGNIAKCEVIFYKYNLYCLKNRQFHMFNKSRELISKSIYGANLDFLSKLVSKAEFKDIEVDKLTDDVLLLYYYYTDRSKFSKEMDSIEDRDISLDSMIYLKYLEVKLVNEGIELEFLSDLALPSAMKSCNEFLVMIYFTRWSELVFKSNHYKAVVEKLFTINELFTSFLAV